ncbi:hypothetical protein BDY19DRAFT_904780 [Irpex rosettiformis]|uniref:Uncharacterized protein n=1 Tax=Irpex rosettiformis TaxID=378272 RepID=A0ACB8UAS5_9APHY|nr:hypothetical protein BDY19DRAFT_904780 [Irpex rosettiformis]
MGAYQDSDERLIVEGGGKTIGMVKNILDIAAEERTDEHNSICLVYERGIRVYYRLLRLSALTTLLAQQRSITYIYGYRRSVLFRCISTAVLILSSYCCVRKEVCSQRGSKHAVRGLVLVLRCEMISWRFHNETDVVGYDQTRAGREADGDLLPRCHVCMSLATCCEAGSAITGLARKPVATTLRPRLWTNENEKLARY